MFLYIRNLFKNLSEDIIELNTYGEQPMISLEGSRRVGSRDFVFFQSYGGFMYCLRFFTLFCAFLGVPLEEEEEEEEDTSWAGKLRALVYKIKGPPKPEKEQPTEEEERCPSK